MRLPVAVIALALLVPATASASTAGVAAVQSRGTYYVAEYDAATGEVNDLSVQGAGSSLVLTDPGAEITPGEGCTAITVHSVTCTSPSSDELSSVRASLDDEADRFTSQGPGFGVDAGPGDDMLEGGAGGGTLAGGDGDDILRGGTGLVWLDGGDGADELTGTEQNDHLTGGPGPDAIDGRGEFQADWSWGDVVSYADHDAPVTIDLSHPGAPAGQAGEGDSVVGVESAEGGRGPDRITLRQEPSSTELTTEGFGNLGDDVIIGSPGPDRVDGGGGDDWVRGGAGDDVVGGQAGRDRLDGGGGSNEMDTWDGEGPPQRDLVRCGDEGFVYGEPTVAAVDVIDQSCGRIALWVGPVLEILHGFKGDPVSALEVTPTCWRRCTVRVELHAHNRLVGTASRAIKRDRRGKLTIPLSAAAREELAREGALKVRLSMVIDWGARLRHRDVRGYCLVLHADPAAR